jgi:hypothetical protein
MNNTPYSVNVLALAALARPLTMARYRPPFCLKRVGDLWPLTGEHALGQSGGPGGTADNSRPQTRSLEKERGNFHGPRACPTAISTRKNGRDGMHVTVSLQTAA